MAFLLFALLLPSVAVLLAAGVGMVLQERAMEAAVRSYVLDLAESTAYHLGLDARLLPFDPLGTRRYPFFSWGPSIPGWVAYIGRDGRVIMASPGAANIASIWRSDLPIGTAARVEDKEGAQYTLAIYPITGGDGYVVAAVSWNQLLGGLVRIGHFWPLLIALMALGSFWAIRLLMRQLVRPLQALVAEIDAMRAGTGHPPVGPLPGAAREIESVQDALGRFAEAAVERDKLRNGYVQDIVNAQEKERMDMAREIHDGPLQDVTALLQQLRMAQEEAPQPRIQRTEELAKTVVRELRALCDELAPPWMALGLAEALTELAERLSQTYDVAVNLEFDDDKGFDVDQETTLSLLRILQEAVSNAARHGGATEVVAQVRERDGELVLDIQDNGKGFPIGGRQGLDLEALRVQGHRGLANMRERMSLMKGDLRITSEPGKGTRIVASLPLPQ